MNVTLGKYIPGNSLSHKLDPRIKLISSITLIVLVFIIDNFTLLGIVAGVTIINYLLTGLQKRKIFTTVFASLYIGMFLIIINFFIIAPDTEAGEQVIGPALGNLGLTWRLIFNTVLTMVRIYIMMLSTTILTATTPPTGITKAIEDLLYPLKIIRFPVHIVAMIISISLRFIPTLMGEASRIMKAQSSRGADFKNGSVKTKMKSMVTLIIPLFVSAFSKAEDLGNAMEIRGYDPYEKRTRYRSYPIKFFDIVIFLQIAGLIATVVLYKLDFFWLPATASDLFDLPTTFMPDLFSLSNLQVIIH